MKATNIELWKDIPGFEGEYEASTYGNIRSLKRGQKMLMKQSVNGGGYGTTKLCLNGVQYSKMSHEWICETFNGAKPDGENIVVNHKNGNKLDNRPENLEWISAKMNVSHSITFNKKHGFIEHRSVFTPELVLEIYHRLLSGERTQKLATEYGVGRHAISHIKYKKFWSYILKDKPDIERQLVFTPELALEVYLKLLSGDSVKKLAEEYDVNRRTIMNIKFKKSWISTLKDLPDIENKYLNRGFKKYV